jgi:hypothetical protein
MKAARRVAVMSFGASSAVARPAAASSAAACMRLKAVVISHCSGRSVRKVPARRAAYFNELAAIADSGRELSDAEWAEVFARHDNVMLADDRNG